MNARAKATRNERRSNCLPKATGSVVTNVRPDALDRQVLASEVKPSQPQETGKKRARLVELARRLERTPPKVKALKDGKAEPDADRLLLRAGLMEALGTADADLAFHLLVQLEGISLYGVSHEDQVNSALAALHGINPRDELEGLLAIQMLGVHNLAMEFMCRAALKEQTPFVVDSNINRATRLLRTFVAQVEALNRYRGKGEQKFTVKYVNVHEGGQAVVGTVTQNRQGEGGGSNEKD